MEQLTKEIILHCPRCGKVMIREKTKDRLPFWRCPRCGGEFWDDESNLAEIEYREKVRVVEAQLRERLRWHLGRAPTVVLPAGPPKPGGGNRSGKRRKRQKPWKPPISERYLLV